MKLYHLQALVCLLNQTFYLLSNVQFENVTLHHREALLLRPDELSYGVIKIQATKVMFFLHP